MTNSTGISALKENVVQAILQDDAFFYAIDAKDCKSGSDLLHTHIFKYQKSPATIAGAITFMTILVHTEAPEEKAAFGATTLEIWIYSHKDHMHMRSAKITGNRNDYLSMLLDDKLNGSTAYGDMGPLQLVSNTEGAYDARFLYRRLIFKATDPNISNCNCRKGCLS